MFTIVNLAKVFYFRRIKIHPLSSKRILFLRVGECYNTMQEAIEDLRRCVKQYRDLDDKIRVMNKTLYESRESRKMVEVEMTDILKIPQFRDYDKLKIDDDGSMIKIQRPQLWSKPWSLSKKELQTLLDEYFRTGLPRTSEECHKYICERRKQDLVSTEFSLNRVLPTD